MCDGMVLCKKSQVAREQQGVTPKMDGLGLVHGARRTSFHRLTLFPEEKATREVVGRDWQRHSFYTGLATARSGLDQSAEAEPPSRP